MAFNWQTEYHRYQKYFIKFGGLYQHKKTRTYTGIILSILTVVFFLVFAIRPTLVTITGLVKEIEDQKEVAEKLQEKINSLTQAQAEYNLVETDLYLVDQALPKDPQASVLVKEIEALSRQSGVTLDSFRIDQTQLKGESPSGSTASIGFNLNASGEYQNLKNFLNSFSSLRRIILVKSFTFKSGKSESQLLSLILDAEAYYLQPLEGQTIIQADQEND